MDIDPQLTSNALCALVYLVLTTLLAFHSKATLPVRLLMAACAATGVWAAAAVLTSLVAIELGSLLPVLEVLQISTWLAFLLSAYRAGLSDHRLPTNFRRLAGLGVAASLALVLGDVLLPILRPWSAGLLNGHSLLIPGLYGRTLLTIGGLTLLEVLLRQARAENLWRLKYLYLGVGGIFAYELFVYSEALLFNRVDPLLSASRGAVALIAAPLIAYAAARNTAWSSELNIARRAVIDSTALVGVGLYLVAAGALGLALRASGGDWGALLQVALLFTAILLLVVILSSPSARTVFKRRLTRYLFTHRHDYREQWHLFAEAMASGESDRTLREQALLALAGVVDSRNSGLWLMESDTLVPAALVHLPAEADETAGQAFLEALESHPESVVDLTTRDAGGLANCLPDWIRAWEGAWLLLRLVHHRRVIGFVVLGRSRTQKELHPEDKELLTTGILHIASFLAAELLTLSIEESRSFAAMSRQTAFIAHDLRNLTNELSLTLVNARRHIENPEFRRDMLLSMGDSVDGMQRLLDRLRETRVESETAQPDSADRITGSLPPDPNETPHTTDIASAVQRTLRKRSAHRATLTWELDDESLHHVIGDPDRINAICGHLIQNALEAAGPKGWVQVGLHWASGQSVLSVTDNGPGMTPAYLREHLFHPFHSSKKSGFGLGLYECRVIARELKGDLSIESKPGVGTTARLRLPSVQAPPARSEEAHEHA